LKLKQLLVDKANASPMVCLAYVLIFCLKSDAYKKKLIAQIFCNIPLSGCSNHSLNLSYKLSSLYSSYHWWMLNVNSKADEIVYPAW